MVSVPPSKWQMWTEHIIGLQQQHVQEKADRDRLMSSEYQKQLLAQIRADITRQSGVKFVVPTAEYLVKRLKLGEDATTEGDDDAYTSYGQDSRHVALQRQVAMEVKWRIYMDELQYINLSSSLLVSVGDLNRCSHLKVLDLSRNFLTSIDGLIGNSLAALERLDLHSNQIVTLPSSAEWAEMRFLRFLNLHDNLIADFETVRQLSGAPRLQLLTLYDTVISVRPTYRHFVVNVINSLLALDRHVISDAEIIEDALGAFTRSRFAPLSSVFQCDLSVSSSGEEQTAENHYLLLAEQALVHGLFCKVHRVLKHFSPIIIIQRFFRGYVQRKRFASLVSALNGRQFPHLVNRKRAVYLEAAALPRATELTNKDDGKLLSDERAFHIDLKRLDSRTVDKLEQDSRAMDVYNEQLMRLHLGTKHGSPSVMSMPAAPHASVFSEDAYRHGNRQRTSLLSDLAVQQFASEQQTAEEKAKEVVDSRLSAFCRGDEASRPLAYEFVSLMRMIDTSITSAMLINKQVLLKPAEVRQKPPAESLAAPFRVRAEPVLELDPLVSNAVEKLRAGEDVRIARVELHHIAEEQQEAFMDAQREHVRLVDAPELRKLNKKKLEHVIAAERVPVRSLKTVDELLFHEPKKQAAQLDLAERVLQQTHSSKQVKAQSRLMLDSRSRLAHVQHFNERQRLTELRQRLADEKLMELHDGYEQVRQWEQAHLQTRKERAGAIRFATKQLTIGHTLEQNDHAMLRQVRLSQSRIAAEQQKLSAQVTRKQISEFLDQERVFKHNLRKQQHLESDLLLLHRCNDDLYEAKVRVDTLKYHKKKPRQYFRAASHVTLLPLPTVHNNA